MNRKDIVDCNDWWSFPKEVQLDIRGPRTEEPVNIKGNNRGEGDGRDIWTSKFEFFVVVVEGRRLSRSLPIS